MARMPAMHAATVQAVLSHAVQTGHVAWVPHQKRESQAPKSTWTACAGRQLATTVEGYKGTEDSLANPGPN